ncbi:competence protein CoiA family protein [Steroidobacter cummioxidans]|uniref:competence protein CoiA family protein n=1 Tax=Steroidobacter cummioxidans TaxID=1803913 RepID=UPI000E30F7A0|nr:competence protein CoiA family protein [Steroidobacter cummioxidans]
MASTVTRRDLPHDDQYIGYGLNESGELVHVDCVPRGKACGCCCVSCAEPLIAKQGEIRVHHFAHAQQNQCTGALETLLHRLAKEILSAASVFILPDYTWRGERALRDQLVKLEKTIVSGGRARLSQVLIEPRVFEEVVPDVVLTTQARDGSARTILLEIAVHHSVDAEKQNRLRELNLPALELTLMPEHARLSRSALAARILNNTAGKCWLFHPRELECERRLEELYRQELERQRREQAVRAKANEGRAEPIRQAVKSMPKSDVENPMAEFFAHHGRYPTVLETADVFREAIAKRKSK